MFLGSTLIENLMKSTEYIHKAVGGRGGEGAGMCNFRIITGIHNHYENDYTPHTTHTHTHQMSSWD